MKKAGVQLRSDETMSIVTQIAGRMNHRAIGYNARTRDIEYPTRPEVQYVLGMRRGRHHEL